MLFQRQGQEQVFIPGWLCPGDLPHLSSALATPASTRSTCRLGAGVQYPGLQARAGFSALVTTFAAGRQPAGRVGGRGQLLADNRMAGPSFLIGPGAARAWCL